MYNKLRETESRRNESRVCLVKEVLNRMKLVTENCLKIEYL